MSFYLDHYPYFLLGALLISLLAFRQAKNGAISAAEARRLSLSLFLALSSLFMLLRDAPVLGKELLALPYRISLVLLLLPAVYLIVRFFFAPFYFAFSSGNRERAIRTFYLKPVKAERFGLQYLSLLGILTALVSLPDLLLDPGLWKGSSVVLILGTSLSFFFLRNTLYAETLDNIAEALLRRGKTEKANLLLQRSLIYKKDLSRTWRMLAELHRTTGDLRRSMRYVRFLKKLKPRSAAPLILEARVLFSMKKFPACVKRCRRTLEKFPNLPELLRLGGRASVALGEHRQALEFFEPLSRRGIEDAETLGDAIEAYYKTGDYERVVALYERGAKAPGEKEDTKKVTRDYYKKAKRKL